MIRELYTWGTQGGTAGKTSSGEVVENRKSRSRDQDLSLSAEKKPSSVEDASRDIGEQPICMDSDHSPGQADTEVGMRNRHKKDEKLRYLYICYPDASTRPLDQMTVSTESEPLTDKVLIEQTKKEYFSIRPHTTRLKNLRGFSEIRLARVRVLNSRSFHSLQADKRQFEYYCTPKTNKPTEISWKWPKQGNEHWEFGTNSGDAIDEAGLAKYMLHIWNESCQTAAIQTTRKAGLADLFLMYSDRSLSLPMSNAGNGQPPLSPSRGLRYCMLFLEGVAAPKSGTYPTT
jgi:hypothetical protein